MPRESANNLAIGVENNIWGWERGVLDKANGRAIASSLQEGDYLVLGHCGPGTRVKAGNWEFATLGRVLVAQVTRSLYTATTIMWPDGTGKLYPERIDLDFVSDDHNVHGPVLGIDPMEALRMSANKQGSPLISSSEALLGLAELQADDEQDPLDVIDEDVVIVVNGSTDVARTAFARKEQRQIRRVKFGQRTSLQCDLCGRILPRRMVHAAHVKRRVDASHAERLDLRNVMAACLSGCDALFEHGFVYVGADGLIRTSAAAAALEDLKELADQLSGRRCTHHCGETEAYFAFHRTKTANVAS
ncbi:hypothetical protein [Acrocarpospora macrocephala]|uniref:hypothetical protein n=1 Tax=Acrocarpospora macrocephala TaxID=150177 RepID=UPI0012D34EC0|nr:hypothetical protein [Acrocarpospora macrocephala]